MFRPGTPHPTIGELDNEGSIHLARGNGTRPAAPTGIPPVNPLVEIIEERNENLAQYIIPRRVQTA